MRSGLVMEAGPVPPGDVRAVLVDHQGVRVGLEEVPKVVRDRGIEEGVQLCWQLLQHPPEKRDVDGAACAVRAHPVAQLALEELVSGEPGLPPRCRAFCSGRRIQIMCVVEAVDPEQAKPLEERAGTWGGMGGWAPP